VLAIASSYSFLDVFWDILLIFAWLIFLWIAITVLIDVFRRHDISGWSKALWVIFVVVLPWLGVLVYLIVNHTGMAERRYRDAAQAQTQFDDYVRQTAAGASPTAEIERAKKLLDDGTISQAEFDSIKARVLSGAGA
jgi:predicted PurR-regulated permease PerM